MTFLSCHFISLLSIWHNFPLSSFCCHLPHRLPLILVPLEPTLVLLSSVGENLHNLAFNDTSSSWFLVSTEFSKGPSNSSESLLQLPLIPNSGLVRSSLMLTNLLNYLTSSHSQQLTLLTYCTGKNNKTHSGKQLRQELFKFRPRRP